MARPRKIVPTTEPRNKLVESLDQLLRAHESLVQKTGQVALQIVAVMTKLTDQLAHQHFAIDATQAKPDMLETKIKRKYTRRKSLDGRRGRRPGRPKRINASQSSHNAPNPENYTNGLYKPNQLGGELS